MLAQAAAKMLYFSCCVRSTVPATVGNTFMRLTQAVFSKKRFKGFCSATLRSAHMSSHLFDRGQSFLCNLEPVSMSRMHNYWKSPVIIVIRYGGPNICSLASRILLRRFPAKNYLQLSLRVFSEITLFENFINCMTWQLVSVCHCKKRHKVS